MNPLEQLMNPSSIAVWGASNNPAKMGTMQLSNILGTGYRGKVYPVHRSEETVAGLRAYRHATEVGAPIDLALLVLPTHAVGEVLEECGAAGIKRAIVVSGGFKEIEGGSGIELEREITRMARSHGIRFLGPNCLGIFNSLCDLNTTTIPLPPGGGHIAIASQSGAYTAMINPLLRNMGVKICQTISVGNEADIDLTDCLDYLKDVDEVRAVGLYVETIRRPREFVSIARATVKKKPVVAIYVGGTEAGSRSSLSHTGALTGPDELYDGLFREARVIRADDIDEMIDMLWALSSQPPAGGDRMAVITNSGGPGTSLAYHAEKVGFRVPLFSERLSASLADVTGRLAFVRNPVDLTFETNVHLFKQIAEVIFDSGEVDGAFIYGIFGWRDFAVNMVKRFPALIELENSITAEQRSFMEKLGEVSRTYEKPLLVMSFLGGESDTVQGLAENGIPAYPSASRAARAMRSLMAYGAIVDGLG
jgi:acetyltransferase